MTTIKTVLVNSIYYKEVIRKGQRTLSKSNIYFIDPMVRDFLIDNTHLIPTDSKTGCNTRTEVKNTTTGKNIFISYHNSNSGYAKFILSELKNIA